MALWFSFFNELMGEFKGVFGPAVGLASNDAIRHANQSTSRLGLGRPSRAKGDRSIFRIQPHAVLPSNRLKENCLKMNSRLYSPEAGFMDEYVIKANYLHKGGNELYARFFNTLSCSTAMPWLLFRWFKRGKGINYSFIISCIWIISKLYSLLYKIVHVAQKTLVTTSNWRQLKKEQLRGHQLLSGWKIHLFICFLAIS